MNNRTQLRGNVFTGFIILSLVGLSPVGSLSASQIPVISGTLPDFSDPGNVVLYEDNGDGIYDTGAETLSDVYSTLDGYYYFDSLSLGSEYFVGYRDVISELVTPSALVAPLDDFVGRGESESSPAKPDVTTVMQADAIGGSRRLTTSLLEGSGYIELSAGEYDDTIRFSTGTGVEGLGVLTWDGATVDGDSLPALALHGVDLTAAGTLDAFAVYAGFDSASAGGEFALRLYKQGETSYSELVVPLPINGGMPTELITFPFADFDGPVSPNDVDSVQLVIQNAPGSSDGRIDAFGLVRMEIAPEFFGEVIAVGEPQCSLPMAFALGAILLIRNRRSSVEP